MIDSRADIDDADDILTQGTTMTMAARRTTRSRSTPSRRFTYYTTDVKTNNSGVGTEQDPKCVTVWAPSGENLQSKYGGTDADEVDSGTGKYLLKTETVGSCASCGGGGDSVTRQYFYMDAGSRHPRSATKWCGWSWKTRSMPTTREWTATCTG